MIFVIIFKLSMTVDTCCAMRIQIKQAKIERESVRDNENNTTSYKFGQPMICSVVRGQKRQSMKTKNRPFGRKICVMLTMIRCGDDDEIKYDEFNVRLRDHNEKKNQITLNDITIKRLPFTIIIYFLGIVYQCGYSIMFVICCYYC